MKKAYLFTLLCAMLSGCSATPKFKPFEIAPCEWQCPVEGTMNTCSLDHFQWWKSLEDPLLDEFMLKAALQNDDLQMARQAGGCDVDAAWIALSADVAQNYIKVRASQLRLGVINKNIAAQKETVGLTKDLIKKGIASSIDLAQAEEQFSQLSAKKPLLELTLHQSIHHLSVLLGYPPGELCSVLCESNQLPVLPCKMPIGSPLDLLRRRPDVQQAYQGFLSCRKNEQAFYAYEKAVLQALEDAENGIMAMRYSWERNKQLKEAYSQSKDAYQQMHQLYERGLKDYLDLLVINRTLLTTEDDYLQTEIDLVLDYIALYKSLGGSYLLYYPNTSVLFQRKCR